MSLFSIIGIIVLVIIVVAGGTLKIVLKKRRKKIEGLHGIVESGNVKKKDVSLDDWESL